MAGRRPLNNAFQMPAEKLAFIRNEPLSPTEEQGDHSRTSRAEEPAEKKSAAGCQPSELGSEQESSLQATRRPKRESRKTDERPSLLGELRVPLTTRLLPALADALRRANLEQRLKRHRPATQQEIVEAAVHDWLKRNGYLDF